MEDTGDTEVISCFIFYCWSVNFDWSFLFMKSWTNKVFFFSSNSISFILLTRSNFFHIHTGNGLEEVLENQEARKERRESEGERKKKTKQQAEQKEIFFFFFFFLMEMMMMTSTMMMGMTVGMMTMMMQRCWSSDASIGTIIHYIYSFDITHSLFMEVCPYFDIYCAHCITVHSRIWMFLLSKRLRWLPPSHPHELYDCSNDFTFIPYTSLTHVLTFTEESIPVVEIHPLIFFKISS